MPIIPACACRRAVEYHFSNISTKTREAIFSLNSQNFMHLPRRSITSTHFEPEKKIKEFPRGFLLWHEGTKENPHYEGGFAIFTDEMSVKVNHHWFRGSHFDAKTINWKNIRSGKIEQNPPVKEKAAGASLFVPFKLNPGEEKTIYLKFCWYVPHTNL
jgi:hypothetical protein